MSDRLFDPKTTVPPKCGSCGATAKNICQHDADIEHGLISRHRKRPRTCLNAQPAYDPATAPLPEGF